MNGEIEKFSRELPKIELHAHLNGSLSPETLQCLVERKKEKNPHLTKFKIPNQKLEVIDDFFKLFKFIYQLTDDEETVAYITETVIHDFHNDGIKYLELRTTPRSNEENGMTHESYIRTVISVIKKFPSSKHDIIVRLIISINRQSTLEDAIKNVDLALKYKETGVVGVDLCGDPTKGHFDNLKPAFIKAKDNGLKVTLHFGEVESIIPEHASMLTIPPDRVGHATHLDANSKRYILFNRLPIEMCMTSNVMCNTVKDYQEHHIKDFLYAEHPCCLCVRVFFSNLSTEYSIAASTFSLSHQQLFDLSYQCIDCIFDGDEVKIHLKKLWNDWWELCKSTLNTLNTKEEIM
ncbi:2724_t:CDS:2 [Diversispora eburnea]|uniref:2724_t:CDS:1 n=1 Tax=Diversispora eburnea TaxID=1213867 RepID=A0A9N9FH93_9GLOM|nr:2724_t:CDS:2 [Diversispora eburnea]